MGRFTRLLALGGALGGALWIRDARHRADERRVPLAELLAHDVGCFATRWVNPIVLGLGLAGGRRSAWAVVEHVGRESGTVYHAPVYPIFHEDQVFIRLAPGPEDHWVRNVRGAGHCRLQLHETVYQLDEPMPVSIDAPLLPLWARPLLSDRRFLRMHVLDAAPGTFLHPRETVDEDLAPEGEHLAMLHGQGGSPEDVISPS